VIVEMRAPEAIMPPALFRHRVIGNSAAASMLTAVAMFGATLFIPLFIQTVIGSSAARSGAVLTPMMATMVVAAGASGFLVSRRGRYKSFAVFGAIAATVGLFLMSRLNETSSYTAFVLSMVVLGTGLGVTMPIFPLAVQNAVDASQTGMATAAIQFVRSLGGSLGAALFGAVLSNAYAPAFRSELSPAVVALASPDVLARFSDPQTLVATDAATRIAAQPQATERLGPVMAAAKAALAVALHDVFLLATILVGLTIIFTMMLVDIPLRTTNRRAAADAA
jgi:MFS family permease